MNVHNIGKLALGAMWLTSIFALTAVLMNYQYSAGPKSVAPVDWPVQSHLKPAPNQLTLVMLAHPQCPCTRASVEELAKIMSHSKKKMSAYVLFIRPSRLPADWEEETDLCRSARAIPGVTVVEDRDGEEANHFKSETSGETLVYASNGKLLFSGGITASRGQSGDNEGAAQIVALNSGNIGTLETQSTLVFGCPLKDPPEPK